MIVAQSNRRIGSLLALAFALGAPGTAQELSPEIQVDRFLLEAERQIGDGDFAAALEALDRVLAIQAEHDLELPAVFWLRRAQVAMEAGLYDEALGSATRYLQLAGREGEDYRAALELLNEAERWLAEGVFRDCAACPLMVEVPAGSFMMGLPSSQGSQYRVTIRSPFAVGVYEVTFDEWDACVRRGACEDVGDEGWGRGRRPVLNVSWEDAQGYVRWLARETGQRYRLPSEAEWEYAARAGTESAQYWGESTTARCRYANTRDASYVQARQEQDSTFTDRYARCRDGFPYTAPVGSYQPNAFGLHDVLGNLGEWTEDCYNGRYAAAPTDGSAWRSDDCPRRVVRGMGWYAFVLDSRGRYSAPAGSRDVYIGIRVARTIN